MAIAMATYGYAYCHGHIRLLWYADTRDMRHNLHHIFGFVAEDDVLHAANHAS